MNLEIFKNWDIAFYHLGSKVSSSGDLAHSFSLEDFFCYGINHSLANARIFSAFSHLIRLMAPKLDLIKIKDTLKNIKNVESSLLGYYLDVIEEVKMDNSTARLQKLAKATPERVFFKSFKKTTPKYQKWGQFGPVFDEPQAKYIDERRLFRFFEKVD